MKLGSALVGVIILSLGFLSGPFGAATRAEAAVPRLQYKNASTALTFEVLTDGLIHFEYSPLTSAPATTASLKTSPFVQKTDYTGAPGFASLGQDATVFQTRTGRVEVDAAGLCFGVTDLQRGVKLTRICPTNGANGYALTLSKEQTANLYGLGEQFTELGQANHDWMGLVREPPYVYGNGGDRFGGNGTGNNQFPVLYALGPGTQNFALYLDTAYALRWNFASDPWKVDRLAPPTDPAIRGYLILGQDLPALRTQYMDLVGHPLVPPKKALGLWVSEYGYRNWDEIRDKLEGLREAHFPIDGFVSDLYWFGGIANDSPDSAMGRLDWDLANFPDPANTVRSLAEDEGVGLMLIEESYVSRNLANFKSMADRGFFVRNGCANCDPSVFDAWWGKGAGIDWTNPLAGAAWHNEHRKKLTDIGITFHWTDLGEPENWFGQDIYANGATEADAHNFYNFLWDKSIADGYAANHETARHFILSRSGGPGIQRFGAAMWSGDIGANLRSLASHLNVQMNMSLSGMDYFGADAGGFEREALEGDVNEVFTKWFAYAALFDVPVRPHTDNGSKTNETSPAKIGDWQSNRFNIRQRYELAPYYYSLAYRAHDAGEPVIPPLVYYYQTDPNVRVIADEKMIGPDLLGATATELGESSRSVYLPKGSWIEFHTLERYASQGQVFPDVSLSFQGMFVLPLFVREGAILPLAQVDDQTMNVLGRRLDGSQAQDLIARVFSGPDAASFTLYEDDGVTEAYHQGAFATTRISQQRVGDQVTVTVAPTQGDYAGAPRSRVNRIELVVDRDIGDVRLNGRSLERIDDPRNFDGEDEAWTVDDQGMVLVKTDEMDVRQAKVFTFEPN